MITTKVHENIVDPWIDKGKLVGVIAAHSCAVPTPETAGTTPGSKAVFAKMSGRTDAKKSCIELGCECLDVARSTD
jgi:hypothetical protein